MPDVLVTDKETGEERFIPGASYDPGRHVLQEGQVATVDPLGEGGQEFAVGEEVSEESLRRADQFQEVSPERRAELTREQVDDEVYDTTANTLEQGLLGGLSGGTLGLSSLALGSADPFKREEQRRKRGQASTAFQVGELVGSIAPGLLSGGTGTLASVARLAPSARLANVTAKVAARGGYARVVGSSLAEGAVAAVGEEFARQSIAESPDFSAESLMSAAARGGLAGAVGGGLGALMSKGAGKVAKKLAADEAAEMAARATKAAKKAPKGKAAKAAKKAPEGVGLFPTRGKRTSYKRVARKKIGDTSADGARDLGVKIDGQVGRRATSEVDDLMSRAASDVTGETADLVKRARAAAVLHGEAADKARDWFAKYSDDVGLAGAKKRLTKPVSREVEDAGIDALGDLDRVAREYDNLAEELAATVGATRVPMSAPTDGVGDALSKVAGLGQRVGGAADVAGTVLGAAEVAGTLGVEGVPTTRDIPGIGGLVSGYLQLKAASRLGGKVPGNWFRSSALTEAAENVVGARSRITASVKKAAQKALGRVGRSDLPRVTGTQLAARLGALETDRQTAVEVSAQFSALGPEVQTGIATGITRAADHLLETAPRPPVTGTSLSTEWRPDPADVAEWLTRVQAVQDPIATFQAAVQEPGNPGVGFESARTVYPAKWEQYRAGLDDNRAGLLDTYDDVRLTAIGRSFALPLTVANLSGYGSVPPGTAAPAGESVDLRFSSPTQVSTSPLVTLEQSNEQRRRS